jgi:uncharacterized protein YcbX
MLGEPVQAAYIECDGMVGDRVYALVDQEDGMTASAKNPRKWGQLLHFRAAFVEEPSRERDLPPVAITFPDGSVHRSDAPDVDEALSAALGRRVTLSFMDTGPKEFEAVDAEGLAPEVYEAFGFSPTGTQDGYVLGRARFGSHAPDNRYFDAAVLHILTTATLHQLRVLAPNADFDERRFRPNIVLDSDGEGFIENEWVGRTVTAGDIEAMVLMEAGRCVITTLPQQGLARDQLVLRTIAQHNKRAIPDVGKFACAGIFVDVAVGGMLHQGDVMVVH